MERLAKIRGGLIDLGLDAVLITDELNQRYATGFAFTDGAVLITLDRAFLITDIALGHARPDDAPESPARR